MPFTGILDEDIVWPDDVDDSSTVTCPNCGDKMHVRSGHTTEDGVLKPRCFVHNPYAPVGGMCPGGESDQHKLMKYVVSRRLRRMYDHGTVERECNIPETDRIGDVVVTFEEPFGEFGRGVVAEVQYRHDDKDIEAVTTEYLQSGYSVYWLNESHFSSDFETVELSDLITAWPNCVPTTGEWQGLEPAAQELDKFGTRYPIEVKFPPELIESQRQELKNWWRMGYGKYNFDLVRPLSANNSSRSCGVCGDSAEVYLFQDGVISTFRCNQHIPQSEDEDQQVNLATDGGWNSHDVAPDTDRSDGGSDE